MDKKWIEQTAKSSGVNPLQELHEILTRSAKDMSKEKTLACMYGIIVGWDDESYKELKESLGWTDSNVEFQKDMNAKYTEAWNLVHDQLVNGN